MGKSLNDLARVPALVETARLLYERGWMPGTAGNVSARDQYNSKHFWITGSGLPKGRLEERDFICVDVASAEIIGAPRSGLQPSAETSLHRVLYQYLVDANVCLHVHTVDACVAEKRHGINGELPLPKLEMIKGLGIWDDPPQINVPIFPNHHHVPKISADIAAWLTQQTPCLPAIMVAGHGVTVWGQTAQEALNRLESIEFLFTYLART